MSDHFGQIPPRAFLTLFARDGGGGKDSQSRANQMLAKNILSSFWVGLKSFVDLTFRVYNTVKVTPPRQAADNRQVD